MELGVLKVANRATDQLIQDVFLATVERRIKTILDSREEYLPQSAALLTSVAGHLCLERTAKRVRPFLCMFFADAIGADQDSIVDLAVAAELFHSASLLHDDVIDDAATRRGISTANINFGNSVAVLGGNYLLSLSFSLLYKYPPCITRQAVDVISHMTRAAIAEIEVRGSLATNTETWRKIAIGKTGRLFSWCGQAVAMSIENIDAADRFDRCGGHIGVAFQLADDIRDLCDPSSLKDLFADIRNKEPSFPLLIASQEQPSLKAELESLWSQETIDKDAAARLGQRVISSGALETTCYSIRREIDQANDSLGAMINSNGGRQISSWMSKLYQSARSGFKQTT